MKDLIMALGQIIGVFFVIATAVFAVNFVVKGFSSINKNELNYYKK